MSASVARLPQKTDMPPSKLSVPSENPASEVSGLPEKPKLILMSVLPFPPSSVYTVGRNRTALRQTAATPWPRAEPKRPHFCFAVRRPAGTSPSSQKKNRMAAMQSK